MNKNLKLLNACKEGNLTEVKKLLNRRFFKPNINANYEYH